MIEQTRKQYARAWKAWKKANRIRQRLAALTGNRNGPGKAWADECRVMLSRAEREHRAALRRQEQKGPNEWLQTAARIQVCAEFFGVPPHDPTGQRFQDEGLDPRGYPPAI